MAEAKEATRHMKYAVVIALRNIEISENLGRGDSLVGSLRISNDRATLEKVLNQPFREAIGGLEAEHLATTGAFLYAVEDTSKDLLKSDLRFSMLRMHLLNAQALSVALWLLRDNAAHTELGYIEYPAGGTASLYSSNLRGSLFTRSDLTLSVERFSRAELRLCREYFRKFAIEDLESSPNKIEQRGHRLERSLLFLQAARAAARLSMKIAHYCTSFECLVSTDSTELSHKVAERLAILLRGTFPSDEVFATAKKAYSVRSKVVHGDIVNTKEAELVGLVSRCDQYLRTIMRGWIDNEEASGKLFPASDGPKESVEQYFTSLLCKGIEGF